MRQKVKETLGYIINGVSIAFFFFLAFAIDIPNAFPPIRIFAWILLGCGVLLTLISIVTLVSDRKSELIDWGIYGLVRHPMYLGAIAFFLSWIFFFPNWIIILISAVNIAVVYWFILQGERQNVIKFGDSYQRYMETVPRINLLAGLFKRLQNK